MCARVACVCLCVSVCVSVCVCVCVCVCVQSGLLSKAVDAANWDYIGFQQKINSSREGGLQDIMMRNLTPKDPLAPPMWVD